MIFTAQRNIQKGKKDLLIAGLVLKNNLRPLFLYPLKQNVFIPMFISSNLMCMKWTMTECVVFRVLRFLPITLVKVLIGLLYYLSLRFIRSSNQLLAMD